MNPADALGAQRRAHREGGAGVSNWSTWADESCRVVLAAGQWRGPRTFDALGPAGLLDPAVPGPDVVRSYTGRPDSVISFASNDYLGLSCHPEVVAAAHRALDRWGAGSGASRLVTGSRPIHRDLEEALAEWKECDRALLFPTGFAANLSVLSVFGTEGAHVFSDELNHASIIDGCRLSRAKVSVYRHGDMAQLDAALSSVARPIIVSDTVFSMDGDCADLESLFDIAERHGALLVLDEAHAVLGPELPTRAGRPVPDVLRVGTLSKTLGALGGFVCGPARFVELLVNRARPYIFTTAPTPADSAAALAAVGVVCSPEGVRLSSRLAALVERVGALVGADGHSSPIIPVVIGEEVEAVAASDRLLADGLWVPAIRPPTVPAGTSRLRITLSAVHTDGQVGALADSLVALGLAARPGPARPTVGGARAT